jgi:hypothetical protein
MILLDREDVDRLGLWQLPFYVEWDMDDPVQFEEGTKADWADIPADGPFLLVVNDEWAWAGQREDGLYQVAQKRADPINLRWWQALADMYAAEMGISRQSLVLRFSSVRRKVRRNPDQWFRWEDLYHWPEGGDLAWSALMHGRWWDITVRERDGKREARFPPDVITTQEAREEGIRMARIL